MLGVCTHYAASGPSSHRPTVMQTDPLTCSAPKTRAPADERPFCQVDGADVRRHVSAQSLMSPLVCYSLEVWSFSRHFPCCDLSLSVFCWLMFLSRRWALPSVVCVHLQSLQALPCATLLWNPLVFHRVISAEDESSFCVNSLGDDIRGNLCFPPFTHSVSMES